MLHIIFESHGTTTDNEEKLASGWNDPALSPLGETQAREMGKRYEGVRIDVVFPSDQKRAVQSAEIGFAGQDLLRDYDGKTVMIIGSRATQYGLENLLNKVPLEEVIPAKWHWQPGWRYELSDL